MENIKQISLNGIVFNVEEDGYIVLKQYIDNLERYYRDKEDGKEIVEDIQMRFSELLLERRTFESKAITLKDIEEAIAILGYPENFEQETNHTSENQKTDSHKRRRRLYRDKENARIAGVCSGLAYYTGIDAWLFRLLFIVLCFFSFGFWLLVYVIAWFIIPSAETTSQRYEMRGEALNIEDIEQRIKNGANEMGEKAKNFVNNNADTFRKTGNEVSSTAKNVFSFIGKLIGICFIVTAVVAMVALITGWFTPSSFIFTEGESASIFSINNILKSYGINTVASVLLLLCIIFPLIVLFLSGILFLTSKNRKSLSVTILVFFIIWIVLCIFMGIGMASYIGERKINRTTEIYEKKIPLKSKTVIIKPSQSFQAIGKRKFLFNGISLGFKSDSRQVYGITNLSHNISYTSDTNVVVRITKESATAEHASEIDFPIEVRDSIIYIPSTFPLKNNYWGGEKVRVQLFIPDGTAIIIDK